MPLQRAQIESHRINWSALNMSVLKRHKCRAPVAILPDCVFLVYQLSFFILNDA